MICIDMFRNCVSLCVIEHLFLILECHVGFGRSLLPVLLREEVSWQAVTTPFSRQVPGLELLSLDCSESCIRRMQHLADEQLRWEVGDVTELDFDSDFDAVVEKGCLDALLCSSEQEASGQLWHREPTTDRCRALPGL